jgi:hypothetical protein
MDNPSTKTTSAASPLPKECAHLAEVARRLSERYGRLPFYANAAKVEGPEFWLKLAGSAFHLDGVGRAT